MTENAAVYRPSPRPRPAGAPQRPSEAPTLRIVPAPTTSEVPVAGNPEAPLPGGETAGHSVAVAKTRAVVSDLGGRVSRVWAASCGYWTPPAVFTDKPASLQELAEYARTAPWTAQDTGVVRAVGVWWYRLVGYPITVTARYSEWVWQRPGRLIVHAGLVKVAANTGPGSWAVDHIVYPAAHLAGHIFL